MAEQLVDFPSDRERFRQQFGYEFPYGSDDDPASIDEHYGNAGRTMGGSFIGSLASSAASGTYGAEDKLKLGNSYKSSETGSELLGITEEPLRLPLSTENLAKATETYDYMVQRRISELTNSYQSAPLEISVTSDGDNGNLMDTFLKTIDELGRSSAVNSNDRYNCESTFNFGAIDQSAREGSRTSSRRESIRSKPSISDKSVTEKSMAESTFFFGNISTSDEGTTRMSRERINIPTIPASCGFLPMQSGQMLTIPTFPMQDSDIDLNQLQSDDKSVRSALTCDRSYAIEETIEKLHEKESTQDDKTDNSIQSTPEDELLNHKSRTSSPASRKSCTSSHYGSFMGWPDSDKKGESSEDDDDDEEEEIDGGEFNESTKTCNEDSGAIVCDFPQDRMAFRSGRNSLSSRGSFQSASSSKGSAASSSRKSSTHGKGSTKSKQSSRRKNRTGTHRCSLETITPEKSIDKSYRKSMRKSLTESIERQRESFRRSAPPRRKSLTQLHDETSSALPLMGWDDSLSDSSSLVSSSSRKLNSSARKSFSSSLSKSDRSGGLFCDQWVTRSSFKRGHHLRGISADNNTKLPDEEFDSKKPWMKAPQTAAPNSANRRGSAMTLDSSIISLKSLDKKATAQSTITTPSEILNPGKDFNLASSKGMRSSFASATSSLGDDQSISSDLTELRQAQEALFAVKVDDEEEQRQAEEAEKLLASFTVPTATNDVQSPTPCLESVEEEEEETTHQQSAQVDRLETVEEEQDDEEVLMFPDNKKTARRTSDHNKPSFIRDSTGNHFLDDLEVDVSQRSTIQIPKVDDSDTFSDIETGNKKSDPSLGLYMSVHDHDIEKEFNTTEMEEIDFKECHKQDLDQSEDLETFLNSGRNNRSSRDHDSSQKSGKSSSKRSGLASLRVISNKWKPIKDRMKKKSGSNHVRRRHKRLYKFCVWNWKKITVLIALVLCVLAGIAISSWYGASRNNNTADEVTVDDQIDYAPVDVQWPPVVDTGRNPIHESAPTATPSLETSSEAHNISSANDGGVQFVNSSLVWNQSSMSPLPPHHPTLSGENASFKPTAARSSWSPVQTTASPIVNSLEPPAPALINSTSPSPTAVSADASAAPSLNLNQTFTPSTDPSSKITQFETLTPVPSNLRSYNTSWPTFQPTVLHESLFQSRQLIAGDDEFQYTGASVSMSPSGKYIAVGMKEAYDTGMVRVYVKKKGYFIPMGVNRIVGDYPGDEFGSSVSISDDGKRIAVGARSSSLSGKSRNGAVKVYKYSESRDEWLQVGDTIQGLEDLERLGFAVDISGDGLRVACGSPKGSGGRGSVSIFEFHSRRGWKTVGNALIGDKTKDMAGFSVSLSSDGTIVAVGAISASLDGLNRCGSVALYSLNKGRWVKLGQVLAGLTDNAQFGYSLKLSGDGRRLVVGSNGYSIGDLSNVGSCEVFELNSETTKWKQIGELFGDDSNEEAGHRVSMSEDGVWIACSKTTFTSSSAEGMVMLAKEDMYDGAWVIQDTITPYFENSTSFGVSTYLSRDGMNIIIGAPQFNNSIGYVELFTREE